MTFWTNDKLRAAFEAGVVQPFDPLRIKQAAYELGVSRDYAITTTDGDGARVRADDGNDIKIPPGQFALLQTEEILKMPADAMGFVSVKATWKLKGLVNVSGFHVDPGFHGRVKFSVYNASGRTIYVQPKRPLFQVWLNGLTEDLPEESLYPNKHPPETGILDDEVAYIGGMVASPAGLNTRIDALDQRVTQGLLATDAELRKVLVEGDHRVAADLQRQLNDLSVKLAKLQTHKNVHWAFISALVIAIVTFAIGVSGDWFKSKRDSTSTQMPPSQANASSVTDAGVVIDAAVTHTSGPAYDAASDLR